MVLNCNITFYCYGGELTSSAHRNKVCSDYSCTVRYPSALVFERADLLRIKEEILICKSGYLLKKIDALSNEAAEVNEQ